MSAEKQPITTQETLMSGGEPNAPRILHLVAPHDPWEAADRQPITEEHMLERQQVVEHAYEGMDCN